MARGRKRKSLIAIIVGLLLAALRWAWARYGDYELAKQLFGDNWVPVMDGVLAVLGQWWVGPLIVVVAVISYVGMGAISDWFAQWFDKDNDPPPPPPPPPTQQQQHVTQNANPVVNVYLGHPDSQTPKDVPYTGGGFQAEYAKQLEEDAKYEARKKDENRLNQEALQKLLQTPTESSTSVTRAALEEAERDAESKTAEFLASKTPLDLKVDWFRSGTKLALHATSMEAHMLKGVTCTLIEAERYAEKFDKFVHSQETHPGGKFVAVSLPEKHDMFFDQKVSFGRLRNLTSHLQMDGSTLFRIATPAIWRFIFVLCAEDRRQVTKTLCVQWDGKDVTPVACPGAVRVSQAHPPINPVRA